jgi:transcriptional regulator with XRE-family HTH domain
MSEKPARDTYEFSAKQFGGHVRVHRLRVGMTQQQLAYRCGLHPTTISRLENGRREPSLVTVYLIAGGLGVAPKALLQ